MKKLFPLTVLITITALAIVSCQPDKDPPQPTHTDLLTKAPWKFENSGIDVNRDGNVDVGDLEPCQTDDLVTFFKDNVASFDPKEQKCDPDDMPESVKWSWRDAEQKSLRITYSDGSADDVSDVLELSETRLVLKIAEPGSPVGIADFLIILKH
jgi:Lipocalin-like domain